MLLVAENTLSRYLGCRWLVLINSHVSMVNRKLFPAASSREENWWPGGEGQSEPEPSPTPLMDMFHWGTLIRFFCTFPLEISYKLIVEYAPNCQWRATFLGHRKMVFEPLINCCLLSILSWFKGNVFTGSKQMISFVKSLRLLN